MEKPNFGSAGATDERDQRRDGEQADGRAQLLALLLDELPQMAWISSIEAEITYVNPRLREFMGPVQGAGLQSSQWGQQIHPEDRTAAVEKWEHFLKTGEAYDIRIRIRRADGIYRWVLVRSFPIRSPEGAVTHVAGTLMDIHDLETNHQRMEKLQRVSAALSGALTRDEVAQTVIHEGMKATGATSGVLGMASESRDRLQTLYFEGGLEEKELVGFKDAPIDKELPMSTVLLTGEPLFFDDTKELIRRFPRVKGLVESSQDEAFVALPLIAQNVAIGVMAFGFKDAPDMSVDFKNFLMTLAGQGAQALERARIFDLERSARAQVERSEARLRMALEASDVGLWDWDLGADKLWWAGSYAKIFGYEKLPADWTARSFLSHIHPDDRESVRAQFDEFFANPTKKDYSRERRIVTPQGKIVWTRSMGTVERDPQGKPLRSFGVLVDITQHKGVEEALKLAKEEAEVASSAKTAFVANMSHEFRTPLTAILGFTEFLAKEGLTSDKRSNYADGIRRNGQVLLKLVEDILDLSRVEAGRIRLDLQASSPRIILEDVVEIFRPDVEKKAIELNIIGLDALPLRFVTDPVRLRQILMNLVGNAVKFTDKGSVSIEVKVRTIAPTSYLEVFVRDTGAGLSPSQVGKLFHPFGQAETSTSRRFGGTGLGLFISRGLARALGGEVELLESELGKGSLFVLRLADLKDQLSVPTENVAGESAVSEKFKGQKILIAEDTEDLRDFLGVYLRDAGCEVDFAENGAKAVELATLGDYDIVLMDLHMPIMDGYEATRALRENGYRVPIVAFTARNQPEDRVKCFEMGFDAFLSKPLSLRDLEGTLRRLFRRQK